MLNPYKVKYSNDFICKFYYRGYQSFDVEIADCEATFKELTDAIKYIIDKVHTRPEIIRAEIYKNQHKIYDSLVGFSKYVKMEVDFCDCK